MRGRSGEPTATTVAWVEPETAPNIVQAAAVETARPPRIWPTNFMTMSISRSADWPRVMMSAAKMNIGTAISEAGWMPASICCTIVSSCPKPPKRKKKPMNAPQISGIIIGNPSSSRPIMTEKMVTAMVQTSRSSSSYPSSTPVER